MLGCTAGLGCPAMLGCSAMLRCTAMLGCPAMLRCSAMLMCPAMLGCSAMLRCSAMLGCPTMLRCSPHNDYPYAPWRALAYVIYNQRCPEPVPRNHSKRLEPAQERRWLGKNFS